MEFTSEEVYLIGDGPLFLKEKPNMKDVKNSLMALFDVDGKRLLDYLSKIKIFA